MEELYKVLYDYDAQRNDELSLKAGEIVRILQNDSEEWCTAEHTETNQVGAVPTNFLEKLHPSDVGAGDGPVLAKVLQDYAAQEPEELSLWKNGIVTVLDQSVAEGWWKGDLNGKIGIFPANHVKLIDAHEQSVDVDETDKNRRQSFKLAAYGVKQGGIGSILAGGFNLRKKTPKKETSHEDTTHDDDKGTVASEKPSGTIVKAMVISSYEPQNDDELQLIPGGYVTVTDKLENEGWWKGLNERNEEGVFPSNFVQILPQEGAPSRPMRARPPTIKTDSPPTPQQQQSLTSPTAMAKPPPVPIGTRPSSLLTRRSTVNSSEQSAPSPPRPITSPPLPSRRANSVIKDHHPSSPSHRRTPSIPLVAPDLPPMRQEHLHDQHPIRPSRPVPLPGSNSNSNNSNNNNSSNTSAVPTSPTSEDRMSGLAKPPKIQTFGKSQATPIVPARTSRPNSQASSIHTVSETASAHGTADEHGDASTPLPPPRVPKRSMPPIPARQRIAEEEEGEPEEPEFTPSSQRHSRDPSLGSNGSRSEGKVSPPPTTSSLPAIIPATKSTGSLQSNSRADDNLMTDPLESKLRDWFKEEAESLRQHFESLLENERSQRLELEMEVAALKQRLL